MRLYIKMADKQRNKDGLGEVPPKRAVCSVETFQEKENILFVSTVEKHKCITEE